jgi:hypothetical protein
MNYFLSFSVYGTGAKYPLGLKAVNTSCKSKFSLKTVPYALVTTKNLLLKSKLHIGTLGTSYENMMSNT